MVVFNNLLVVSAIFLSLIVLDYIWLGIFTKNFIISEFSSLVKVEGSFIKINLIAGIFAWILIAVGCFVFVVNPNDNLSKVLLFGALFGFVVYGIYDLTNLTFIKDYPLMFSIVDIMWGTFLCSAISGIGFAVKSLF